MTGNAKLILDIVNSSDCHLTAEQIFIELKKNGKKVSFATVYNNLAYLCENGHIQKISTVGFADRYDKMVRHDHLICKNCGKLSDIKLENLMPKLSGEVPDMISYDLKIHYFCPECRKKLNTTKI